MKRTPLTRRTPLRRKQRLRPVSKKTTKTKRETDPLRALYVEAADGICEYCGRQSDYLECHEITAGASRQRAVSQPNTWLAPRRECHDELQGMPFGYQAAVKHRAVNRTLNRCLGRLELLE